MHISQVSLQMMSPFKAVSAHTAGKPSGLDLRCLVSMDVVSVTLKVVLPLEDASAFCAHEWVFIGVCPVVTS